MEAGVSLPLVSVLPGDDNRLSVVSVSLTKEHVYLVGSNLLEFRPASLLVGSFHSADLFCLDVQKWVSLSIPRNGSPVGDNIEVSVPFAREFGISQGFSLIFVSLSREHVSLCERSSSVALTNRGHHIQKGVSPSLTQKRDIDDGSLFPTGLRGEDSSDPLDPKKSIHGSEGVSLQSICSVSGSDVAADTVSGDAGSAFNADGISDAVHVVLLDYDAIYNPDLARNASVVDVEAIDFNITAAGSKDLISYSTVGKTDPDDDVAGKANLNGKTTATFQSGVRKVVNGDIPSGRRSASRSGTAIAKTASLRTSKSVIAEADAGSTDRLVSITRYQPKQIGGLPSLPHKGDSEPGTAPSGDTTGGLNRVSSASDGAITGSQQSLTATGYGSSKIWAGTIGQWRPTI